MQAGPAPSNETRYTLCVGDGAARFKLAETELTLSDEGIAYELDGRSGLRPFSKLAGVRLQALNGGPRSPWETLTELTFTSGRPLFVHSSSPWGADDPQRDSVFISFVQDLHRRLIAGGPRLYRVPARHSGSAPPFPHRRRAHRGRRLWWRRVNGALCRPERQSRVLRSGRTAFRPRWVRLLDLEFDRAERAGQLRSASPAARHLSGVSGSLSSPAVRPAAPGRPADSRSPARRARRSRHGSPPA